MMTDGISINGKHSYLDFDLYISNRSIGVPEKKVIRETVPFLNGFYDFSAANGAAAWGMRELSYTFDITGVTVREMDELRTAVLAWLCNVQDDRIYDDTIPDFYFVGSYDKYSQTENGEQTELTVSFICQPFKTAMNETRVLFPTSGIYTINNGGQTVIPTVYAPTATTITIGTSSQSLSAGTAIKLGIPLERGTNAVTVATPNIIVPPYVNTTRTTEGITFTVQSDGSVTADGTATGVAWFYFRGASDLLSLNKGAYTLRGCPTGGGANYRLQMYVVSSAGNTYYYDTGSGVKFSVGDDVEYISIAARVGTGTTVDNMSFTCELYGEVELKYRGLMI